MEVRAFTSFRNLLLLCIAAGALSGAEPKDKHSVFISDAQFTITSKKSASGRILIDYRLMNKSNQPLLTFDPACLFRYSFPIVLDENGRELQKVETLTTACAHQIHCVGPKQSLKGTFGVNLGRMVPLEDGMTYTVEFAFRFEPRKAERKTLEKVVKKGELAKNAHFFVGALRSNSLKIQIEE